MLSTKQTSKHVPIAHFISDAHLLLANALLPAILPHIAARGYAGDQIVARLAEVEALRSMAESRSMYVGNRMSASAVLKEARAALHLRYMEQVGIARIALKADHTAQVALGLQQRRQLSYTGYIDQGLLFCNNLLADAGWMAAMAAMGVSGADVTDVRTAFEGLRTLLFDLKQKTGEVLQHTADCKAAHKALREWITDFRAVTRIALRQHPQMCEQLGIKQKS